MRPVVVFDTNILFSGLGWRGKAHQCLMAAREGIVESVTRDSGGAGGGTPFEAQYARGRYC